MREIKFRYVLYNREKKEYKFFHFTLDDIQIHSDKWIEMCDFKFKNGFEVVERDRWTGNKDAMGREVYEGDIIKRGKLLWMIYFGCNSFSDRSFGWSGEVLGKPYKSLCGLDESILKGKIIGNVYENYKLVKAKGKS